MRLFHVLGLAGVKGSFLFNYVVFFAFFRFLISTLYQWFHISNSRLKSLIKEWIVSFNTPYHLTVKWKIMILKFWVLIYLFFIGRWSFFCFYILYNVKCIIGKINEIQKKQDIPFNILDLWANYYYWWFIESIDWYKIIESLQ